MKTAFLFSGQGSQYPSMGADIAQKYGAAREILECGSDIMGFDIMKRLCDSTPEELAQTRLSQPAIFTVSLLALTAARENGIENAAVAGHSLGEYAAMYASGMLSLESAYKAIKLRSEAMAKAAENSSGAMAAVIGCDNETIEKICAQVDGFVAPANYNCPVQTVIAGEAAAVDAACAALTELGKRSVKLAVSAAFHTKLMAGAAEEFKAAIAGFTDFADMPAYLSAHICSPVRFVAELEEMNADGIDAYVELGPGKVLTGLVKKTWRTARAYNIENCETLDKALAALKA